MRSRAAVLAVPALLGPGLLACFAGGYGDRARLVAGIAAWLILAVAALVLPRPLPRGRAQWAALAGLAGLAAWTAASLSWTPVGEPAGKDVQRLVLYVGALAAGIAILRARAAARLAEPLLLAGVTAACLYGLSDRLLPSVFHLERVLSAGDRLAQPLTYWNATGAFAALGLLLAAGIAGDRGRPGALRAAAAGCAPPLGLALYLTFSRGALGALAAGFAVLIAVAPERARLRAAAVVIAGAALPSVATVALPAVATADSGPKQGPAMLLLLLGLAGAAALVQRAAREGAPAPLPGLRIAALAGLALALAVTGYAVSRVEHGSGTDSPAASPSRLASVQSNRYAYWRVALRTFGDHPLRGEGSGGFATVWLKERPFREPVRDAHSLYLETPAELGLVGVALLALLLGGVVAAAIRARPPLAGPLAALAAWALHAGIDWDWEMPALTLVALLLAALVLTSPERAAAPGGPAP